MTYGIFFVYVISFIFSTVYILIHSLDVKLSTISVVVNNMLNKDVFLVQFNTNGEKEFSHLIRRSTTEGHILEKVLDSRGVNDDLGAVRFQLMEVKTGLLLMFPDRRDYFDVTYKPYRQKYVVNIGKDCK